MGTIFDKCLYYDTYENEPNDQQINHDFPSSTINNIKHNEIKSEIIIAINSNNSKNEELKEMILFIQVLIILKKMKFK